MTNKIAVENALQGNPPSEWGLSGAPTDAISGFATDISTNVGGTVEFKIDTSAASYRVDIYRLGYYGGDGARKVASMEHDGTTFQPYPLTDPETGLVDAGNWSVTDTWSIPADAVSGVYIAKIVRTDGTPGENQIPFIIRDDAGGSDIVLQTNDATWQAYNSWGGASLYDQNGTVAVSYNRPISSYTPATATAPANMLSDLFSSDYPTIRFLEQNGYDVSYMTNVDTARNGASILTHKTFLTTGHDEYWSAEQRSNVEAARDAGVNLIFWTGNDVYWKTRWDESIDGSGTDYRTMITYKSSTQGAPQDPSGTWTGLWRDTAGRYDGATPENALTGTFYMVNYDPNNTYYPYTVGAEASDYRLWRNTAVSNLEDGQSVTLGSYLGYEWNVDADNGFRPNGLVHLSTTRTAVSNVAVPSDPNYYGINFQYTLPEPGFATHNLTLYKDDSGALVFSAGTVSWAWALDDHHSGVQMPASLDVQQAMVNLLADMGSQAATLKYGLTSAAKSTDYSGAVAAVSSLTDNGQVATITGTAMDFGGGVVVGVQISTDGGATWRLASGTSTWSYSWNTGGAVPGNVLVSAIDDSANIGQPAILSYSKLQVTNSFEGFDGDLGWDNVSYTRQLVDIDGDGKLDYVGFGDAGMYANFGTTAGLEPTFDASRGAYLDHFGAVEGYTPSYLRDISYVGDMSSVSGGNPNASVVWAQGDQFLYFFYPAAGPDGSLSFTADSIALEQFSLEQGWSKSYNFEFSFLQKSAGTSGNLPDKYASILGFGDDGIWLDAQGFAPGAGLTDTYLINGSQAFGNLAGWDSLHDIRTTKDHRGRELDINNDGVTDVLAIGNTGVIWAYGQQVSASGSAPGSYTLTQTYQTAMFSRDSGWSNEVTPRYVADVNGDDRIDIVGFGNDGVWVSLGQTAQADGSGAFASAYRANPGFGVNQGWTMENERLLGDLNGDGLLDIIGFGNDVTSVSLGAVNANGQFTWTSPIFVPGYSAAQGWNDTEHFRNVADINGDGIAEIIASGATSTDIVKLV